MNKTLRDKARGGPGRIYLLAGILTWPVVTAVIYWGDRFTSDISSFGQPGASINLWAAGGYSLLVSILILVAGWVQSSTKS